MNEYLENRTCCRCWGGASVDGASAAGVLHPTRWGCVAASRGSSPRIWLSFLVCFSSLCFSLSSRSFVVGGRDIDDTVVLSREEHEELDGNRDGGSCILRA